MAVLAAAVVAIALSAAANASTAAGFPLSYPHYTVQGTNQNGGKAYNFDLVNTTSSSKDFRLMIDGKSMPDRYSVTGGGKLLRWPDMNGYKYGYFDYTLRPGQKFHVTLWYSGRVAKPNAGSLWAGEILIFKHHKVVLQSQAFIGGLL